MGSMEIGRVCTKTAGREAGRKCIVVNIIDENFVLIDSPGVKRRRCNVSHLLPTDDVLKIKKGAKIKEIQKALKDAKITLEA
ncbi:MAG: 50S ribosomal protein L14e [Candidatus Hydrothermarchaeaceae archaeon]